MNPAQRAPSRQPETLDPIIKVLLTGFEPFGQEIVNPSLEIVRRLHGRAVGPARIYGAKLPVIFEQASMRAIEAMKRLHPDVIISLGLAPGRSNLGIERVAVNVRDGGPDNAGVSLEDVPIVADGPAAYFSTLPIKAIVRELARQDIPARISNTAGTYCCNEVMYALLHHTAKHHLKILCGFIHVPRLPVQDLRSARANCMDPEVMIQGILIAIQVSAQYLIERCRERFLQRRPLDGFNRLPMFYS